MKFVQKITFYVPRNACPVHSNIKRMAACLNKHLEIELPTSARLLCGLILCGKDDTNVLDPLSWPRDCVLRTCPSCHAHVTEVTEEEDKQVTLAMWTSVGVPGKKAKISNLFNVNYQLSELATKFDGALVALVGHVHTATWQWKRWVSTKCLDNTMTDTQTCLGVKSQGNKLERRSRCAQSRTHSVLILAGAVQF